MARISSKKIETPDLQGEGSYITVKPVSYKVTKEAGRFLAMGDVSQRDDMTAAEKLAHTKREQELTEQLIFGSIIDWSWADDEGTPLPLPRAADDLDLLTADEVAFLVSAIVGLTTGEAKN